MLRSGELTIPLTSFPLPRWRFGRCARGQNGGEGCRFGERSTGCPLGRSALT